MLYEMLARRRPFQGTGAAATAVSILSQDPPPLTARGIPSAIESIVQQCLEKRPGERFQSAHDLALALSAARPRAGSSHPAFRIATIAVVILVAAAAILALRPVRGTDGPAATPALATAPREVWPPTASGGPEYQPALSPDGSKLAFVWPGGGTQSNPDVYVKPIGTDRLVRVTNDAGNDCCPAWSPDGETVVLVRVGQDRRSQVITVSAAGGDEQVVGTLEPWFGTSVSWSPDGRSLVFPDRATAGEAFGLTVLDLETRATRRITTPEPGIGGDALPVFSPNGREIAFARLPSHDPFLWADISVVDLKSAAIRRLHREAYIVGGLDWTADGSELVYGSNRGRGSPRLWRLSTRGGEPQPVDEDPPLSNSVGAEAPTDVTRYMRVSVARAGGRLAYAESYYDANLLRVDALDRSLETPAFIASSRHDEAAQFSPDGRRIAFTSNRGSRHTQIWVADADGRNPTQLTAFATSCGSPSWSPDGREIAFDFAPDGQLDVYVVDAETRLSRRFTKERHTEATPSWSRDGRWIYFTSDRTGRAEVWRAPAEGGDAVQVTREGGHIGRESPDGRMLYYTKQGVAGLFRMSLPQGPETRFSDLPQCKGYWAVGEQAVYVVDSMTPGGPWLVRLDPDRGQRTRVRALPGGVACGEMGLTLHPDGRTLAYLHASRRSEMMLVDNFR
jgi:Tol biopolymer transport system component